MLAWSGVLVLVGIDWSRGDSGAGWVVPLALASLTAFVGIRMMRASVVIDHERVLSRNVWATGWIAGSSITDVRVEERRRGSLWSWGLDTSLPFTWVPLDVVIIEGGGRRIVADALRSDRRVHRDDHPAATVARLRADVIERWRATWWLPDQHEQPSVPSAPDQAPPRPW